MGGIGKTELAIAYSWTNLQGNTYLPPQSSQFKVLITIRLRLELANPLYLQVLSASESLELLSYLIVLEKINLELNTAKELCQRSRSARLCLIASSERQEADSFPRSLFAKVLFPDPALPRIITFNLSALVCHEYLSCKKLLNIFPTL